VLFLSAGTCRAQTIRVLPPDQETVTIHGRAGDNSAFSKRISLISDLAVTVLLVHPSDLERVGGGAFIPRVQVQCRIYIYADSVADGPH
jgi:hypothetical protein